MKNTFISLCIAVGVLSACGGGGGGGSTGNSAQSLTGSVSQGFAITGAQITLIDANGTSVDGGLSDSSGNYSVPDISKLTPPILVIASGNVGGSPISLYSVITSKSASNTANVTPLTDAIVYQAAGTSPTFLVNNHSLIAGLDLTQVDSISAKFTTAVSNVLNQLQAGTASSFNPIKTVFTADGVSAVDRANELLKVVTTITPSGVTTDISDKSGNSGSVSVSNSTSTSALPSIPSAITSLDTSKLNNFIAKLNSAFSSGSALDSQFPSLVASDFRDSGLDKPHEITLFTSTYRNDVIGLTLSNPKILLCFNNGSCGVRITAKFPNGGVTNVDLILKYYANSGSWLLYGNQYEFGAEFSTSLTQRFDYSNGNTATINSQIQFTINKDPYNWDQYKSAKVSLQSGTMAPDLTFNFVLKPTYCNISTSNGIYYDGMPLDDNTNNCWTWQQFDNTSEAILKTINGKIRQGGYVAKFEAWLTSTTRSGPPDSVAYFPIVDPILTTDAIGPSGYPRVTLVQPNTGSLPYLTIDNSDDFTVSGSLCISSLPWCDAHSNPSPLYTSTVMPKGNIKLPSRIDAKASDGWPAGQIAHSYFIHVRDKAGRDLMTSASNIP